MDNPLDKWKKSMNRMAQQSVQFEWLFVILLYFGE